MKVFNINDNYFKYKKCVSGITYHYVNQLDNIYEKNLMVGTNYCIYCMYNEFDIIKNFMVNLNQIDICVSTHLDLSKRYYELDGAYLKTGHKVLLVNQNDSVENDIYVVNSRGYLILSDELSTPEKTWRYKAYIKLGNNKGKQFHLINSGNRFPLKGEKKHLLDGHGYIIKNIFNYDVFDTGLIPPKLIFTDYEIARISVNKNYELYNGFELPDLTYLNKLNINYHGNDYIINIDNDTTKYLYNDIVSGSTIYNSKDFPSNDSGYRTYIKSSASFCSNANINDYIQLNVSGDTNLYLKTFIEEIGSDYIIISDYISNEILNYYYNYTGSTSTYYLINLMYATTSTILDVMLNSYYAEFFEYGTNNMILPKENPSYIYFDYDGLSFIFSGITTISYNFNTDNYYIDYKLYDTLNRINSSIFNTGYSFLIDFNMPISDFDIEYYDNYPNVDNYPTTLGDINGTYIKITPHTPSYTNYFKKYTYLNLNTISDSFKTLIVDVKPNEYFIIESYKSNSGLTHDIITIETLYNLKEISDILYDIYINDINLNNIDYYRLRDDNARKNICNGYAQFISEDLNVINYTTAFLMTDNENKFILKVYDPENLYNGGVIRPPIVTTKLNIYSGGTWAILPGEVMNDGGSNITSIGVCYTLDPLFLSGVLCNEIEVNNYIGEFEISVNYLYPLSTYYYKAYAENEQGRGYGEIQYFNTSEAVYSAPVVMTLNSTPTSDSMELSGNVIFDGYTPITSRGFVYQTGITSSLDIINDNLAYWDSENGLIGEYLINVTGLTSDTTYSYNSFAQNICGITYGSIYNETTL